MKTNMIFLTVIMVVLFGCKKGTTEPTNTETNITATVQGTVFYFVGGGTVEMIYPPGYKLINCRWITPPTDSASSVYLSGIVDSSYLDKRVQVIGTVDTITLHGTPPSYVYGYLRIDVNSIQVTN